MGVAEESKGRLKQLLGEIAMPGAVVNSRPIAVFVSYSHADEHLVTLLESHLSSLRRQGLVTTWTDRQIHPGEEWRGEIDSRLARADIVLLLISADFIASRFCWEVEVGHAMQRHHDGDARVIPIILRPCDWTGLEIGRLQALPTDGRPVTVWPDRDEAYTDIARGIRSAVRALNGGDRRSA